MTHLRKPAIAARRTLIAFGLALLAACGQDLSRDELLDRARGALAEGRVNAAIVDVKTALQQAPADAAGRRLYGEILLRQRSLAQAVEEFRRSLDATFHPEVAILYAHTLVDAGDPQALVDLAAEGFFEAVADDPRYLAARARAEAGDGNFFAAAETLDEAEAIDASLPAVRRARALVLAQHSGDLSAAAELLAGLLEDQPADADAWSLYASLLQAKNELPAAADAFARAGEINPYRLPDRLNHMILLIEQEQYDEAETVIAELDKLLPDNPGVNYAQARLAMVEDDPDKAVEELDAALKAAPEHTPSLYLAANANLRRGNLSMAQSQLESFLAVRPRNIKARLMLATIHLQQGEAGKTLATTRQVLEVQPENETARILLARALAAEGYQEESADAYADIVALKADSPQLRAEYGEALLRAGDAQRGAAELAAAVELAPEDPALRARLVSARLALDDAEGAREEIAAFSAAFPDSPQPALLSAQVALSERDREGVQRHLEKALTVDPGNAAARRGLAGLAMLDDDPDRAAQILGGDMEKEAPDLGNLLRLAAVEERRGDLEAMERVLRRAIEVYPEALAPRLLLARRAFQDERPGEAVDLLTTVRERHGDNPRLQQLLVGAFLALDQPGAAVNAGRQLARLLPDDPVALRLAAQAERLNENLAKSEELLRSAVNLAPDDIETRKLLIESLFLQGDLEGTSEELALLPKNFSGAELIDFARGRLALASGDAQAAERLLRRAHQREPNSASLLFLNTALVQGGKFKEALALLDAWVEANPDDGVIINQLGSLRAVRGEDDEAAAVYEQLLELYPDDVIAMNNLAWSLRESAPARALELADRALEAAPGNPAILDTRAMVLMSTGQYDEALAVLDTVAEKAGEVPPVAFHRAQVLLAAGRKSEAREILEGLVEGPAFAEQAKARELLQSL